MSINQLKIVCLLLLTTVIFLTAYILTNKPETAGTSKVTDLEEKQNFEPYEKYILDGGCTYDMSNNAYSNCVEEVLKNIKIEKENLFKDFQRLINESKDNVLTMDQEENRRFFDWYESSGKFNELKCLASVYWTKAGSAYNQNLYTCEIIEATEDIKIIQENQKEIEEWNESIMSENSQ